MEQTNLGKYTENLCKMYHMQRCQNPPDHQEYMAVETLEKHNP